MRKKITPLKCSLSRNLTENAEKPLIGNKKTSPVLQVFADSVCSWIRKNNSYFFRLGESRYVALQSHTPRRRFFLILSILNQYCDICYFVSLSSGKNRRGTDRVNRYFKKKDCQYSRKIFIVANENVIYRRDDYKSLQKIATRAQTLTGILSNEKMENVYAFQLE